jgi:hypothetical protein
MERSTGSKVVASSYNQGSSQQVYIFKAPNWMRTIVRRVSATFNAAKLPDLPQHRGSGTASACVPPGTNQPQSQQTLQLMVCMQRGRYRRIVNQDRIDNITTDQALFSFLQSQLARHRGRIRKMFSLKCVQGMYFVKVSMRGPPVCLENFADHEVSSVFEHAEVQKSATTNHAVLHQCGICVNAYHQHIRSNQHPTPSIVATLPARWTLGLRSFQKS